MTAALNLKKNPLPLFEAYEHFCKVMLDAYVVIDQEGMVLKSNSLFHQLVGKKSRQISKIPFEDLISLHLDEEKISVQSLLALSSPSRFDEVRGSTSQNQDLNLILGAYPLLDTEECVGFFLLIRDVTAETHLQDKYKVKATQSVTDKLTSLYNRGYLDQHLPRLIEDIRIQHPEVVQFLSLVMVDVDHFKKINDTYGHPGGDTVLSGLAKLMKTSFRKTDVICRYGGEEFLIILPNTKLNEAKMASEKLRILVANQNFIFQDISIPVTVSMGVAQFSPINDTHETLIARADRALYQAKEQGRNRVISLDETSDSD